jgi:hypothetical protein
MAGRSRDACREIPMNVRTSNCAADGGDFFTVGALDPGYGSDHVFCYQLVNI